MPAFPYRCRIAFHDTDAAGIVHFANYFRLAEEAETHALASTGFRMDAYAYPRVHVEADYRAPLRFWDECEIRAGLVKTGNSSLHWRFDFLCQGTLRATISYITSRRHVRDNSPAPYAEDELQRLQNLVLAPVL